MDDFLYYLFHSEGEANHFGYNSLEVDNMITEARATIGQKERISIYRHIKNTVMTDYAFIPVYIYNTEVLVQPYLEGLELSPMRGYDLRKISLGENYREEYSEAAAKIEITGVVITNQLDDNMEPVATETINTKDTVYVSILVNSKVSGNSIVVNWYDTFDNILK